MENSKNVVNMGAFSVQAKIYTRFFSQGLKDLVSMFDEFRHFFPRIDA